MKIFEEYQWRWMFCSGGEHRQERLMLAAALSQTGRDEDRINGKQNALLWILPLCYPLETILFNSFKAFVVIDWWLCLMQIVCVMPVLIVSVPLTRQVIREVRFTSKRFERVTAYFTLYCAWFRKDVNNSIAGLAEVYKRKNAWMGTALLSLLGVFFSLLTQNDYLFSLLRFVECDGLISLVEASYFGTLIVLPISMFLVMYWLLCIYSPLCCIRRVQKRLVASEGVS